MGEKSLPLYYYYLCKLLWVSVHVHVGNREQLQVQVSMIKFIITIVTCIYVHVCKDPVS